MFLFKVKLGMERGCGFKSLCGKERIFEYLYCFNNLWVFIFFLSIVFVLKVLFLLIIFMFVIEYKCGNVVWDGENVICKCLLVCFCGEICILVVV